MKYIESLREGTRVSTVYLCRTKQTLLTKTGKEYFSLLLQDKTGTVDGKIWDPGNPGIGEFDAPDYVAVDADVTMFSGKIQLNVRRVRKADPGEYSPADYLPASERSNDAMVMELKTAIEATEFAAPKCPVYQNYDAKPHTDPAEIKANLIAQLTGSVRWTASVQNMIADGADEFTECGPGKALQGMIGRIDKSVSAHGIE